MATSHAQPPRSVRMEPLYVPELNELAHVFESALKTNFKLVEVETVTCPDLRQWGLASEGLSSQLGKSGTGANDANLKIGTNQVSARTEHHNARYVADIGGVDNMHYTRNHNHIWNFADIAAALHCPAACFVGAGASSKHVTGDNCELMPNTHLQHVCATKSAEVDPSSGRCVLKEYASDDFGTLCNVYGSEGLPGPVIRVSCAVRTGADNPITCLRKALIGQYGSERMIGIGGVFQITEATIKSHVMPNFPNKDLLDMAQVNDWLKFYHVPLTPANPATCLSVFVNADPLNLGLRLDHTHFYQGPSSALTAGLDGHGTGHGGHYHYDSSPDTVRYVGYFSPAQYLARVDPAVAPSH